MVVRQGDVFWADFGAPFNEPGRPRPVVVIQSDLLNRAGIDSFVVCHMTSNLRRAGYPGNVRLARGEANLPKPSVVNSVQISTVQKALLTDKIGTLSRARLAEVLDGVRLTLGL